MRANKPFIPRPPSARTANRNLPRVVQAPRRAMDRKLLSMPPPEDDGNSVFAIGDDLFFVSVEIKQLKTKKPPPKGRPIDIATSKRPTGER
jgi:hypothetical protein